MSAPDLKEAIAAQSLEIDKLVEEVTGLRLNEREAAIVFAIVKVMTKETR